MVTIASRPHPPLLRELSALCVKIPTLTSRTVPQEIRALSLFPATPTGDSQFIENTMPLSLGFGTLTGNVNRKPFVCHSYKKTGGVSSAVLPAQSLTSLSLSNARSTPPPQSSLCVRTATPATPLVSCAYFTVLWIPRGWGPSASLARLAQDGRQVRVRSRLSLRQKPARNIQVLPLTAFHLGNGPTRMEA
jgi:hypothetical protein